MVQIKIQCKQCETIQQFRIKNVEHLLTKTIRYTCRSCKTNNHFKLKKKEVEWNK